MYVCEPFVRSGRRADLWSPFNRTSDEPATVARSTPTGPTPCVSFLPRLQEAPMLTRDGILQYDACDVGTMPNQTDPTTGLPKFGPEYGDKVGSASPQASLTWAKS